MTEESKKQKSLSQAERISLYVAAMTLIATSIFSAYSIQSIEQNAYSIKQNAQTIETARVTFEISV